MTVLWNDDIEALWAEYLRQSANAGAAADYWDPEDRGAGLAYIRQADNARASLVEHLREVGAVADLSDDDRAELLARLTAVAAGPTVQSRADTVPHHLDTILGFASRTR